MREGRHIRPVSMIALRQDALYIFAPAEVVPATHNRHFSTRPQSEAVHSRRTLPAQRPSSSPSPLILTLRRGEHCAVDNVSF